jgi:hypothetical protein
MHPPRANVSGSPGLPARYQSPACRSSSPEAGWFCSQVRPPVAGQAAALTAGGQTTDMSVALSSGVYGNSWEGHPFPAVSPLRLL